MTLSYVKSRKLSLKGHPEYTEAWLRDRILEDPQILGLGDVEIKDTERRQPSGGRLDLLLHDSEAYKRYEVELMLGPVNESHIIRCIEYWDSERKRFPQYDHTAVLVAEDITTRFLNVISLFNNAIPLVAIQLDALEIDDKITLNFTKVLDEIILGDEEEDEGEVATRENWEEWGSKESVKLADSCLGLINEFEPSLKLRYTWSYIGLADEHRAKNFVLFTPKKQFLRLGARVADQKPWISKLEEAGLVVLYGAKKHPRIRFRLTEGEIEQHRTLLKELFQACYQEYQE